MESQETIISPFKKGTTLTIETCEHQTLTESSFREEWVVIEKREKEKHNPIPFADDSIWNWGSPSGKIITVEGITKQFTVTIFWFIKNLSQTQILSEAKKLNLRRFYSWKEAQKIIFKAILEGEVDEKDKAVSVNFKMNGMKFRFNAYRDNTQLRVYTTPFFFKEQNVGYGACFGK